MTQPAPFVPRPNGQDPLLSDPDVEAMPSRLADFELLRDLGTHDGIRSWYAIRRGGFGFHKRVLLKVARATFKEDPSVALRIVEEARVGMALHHPHLLSVLDLGRDGDRYFLVREWVDGLGLRALLRGAWAQGRAPSIDAVLRVGVATARALSYLHGLRVEPWAPRGVVHRAVTPSNVLISAWGEVRLATLCLATPSGATESASASGAPLLPAWTAPEVLEGRPAEPRSDIYSLGALLFEAIAGPHAFEGDPSSDWSRRRDEQRFTWMLPRLAAPERVKEMLDRCLKTDVNARPDNVTEVKDVLRRALREDLGTDGEVALRREVAALQAPRRV